MAPADPQREPEARSDCPNYLVFKFSFSLAARGLRDSAEEPALSRKSAVLGRGEDEQCLSPVRQAVSCDGKADADRVLCTQTRGRRDHSPLVGQGAPPALETCFGVPEAIYL